MLVTNTYDLFIYLSMRFV